MHLLEDILRILGVAGREAEKIMSEMHNLANSRGARHLIIALPKKVRRELDDNLESAAPSEHAGIIRTIIHNNSSEEERQKAYLAALGEIIQQEFLPAVLQEATESQRREIEKLGVPE